MSLFSAFGLFLISLESLLSSQVHGIHFQFPETKPCEMIDLDASFSLRYEDTSGHMEDAPVFSLEGASLYNESSSCIDPDLDHLLDFDLGVSDERLSLDFQVNGSDGHVTMLVYFKMNPSKHFKDMNESAVTMADSTHLMIGDTEHSYRCISEQTVYFYNQSFFYMNMTIKSLQVQAYSVNGSQYSPAVECSLDRVTTEEPISEMTFSQQPFSISSHEPMTSMHTATTSPATVPPSPRPHFEVKNGDIVCLVLDGSFTFTIPYTKNDSTETNAVVEVPDNAESFGSICTALDRELLQIIFFNNSNHYWSLDITVVRADNGLKTGLADSEVTYSWKTVNLTYYIDSHFKDANDTSGSPHTAASTDLAGLFEATSSGSYKCEKKQDVKLDNVTLTISNLQYRAFGTSKDDKFPIGNLVDCSNPKPKKEKDNGKTIGIIVGCVCGGVIVAVVVVFLFLRYRKRNQYKELKDV